MSATADRREFEPMNFPVIDLGSTVIDLTATSITADITYLPQPWGSMYRVHRYRTVNAGGHLRQSV
ncbi:hypothetical protein ACQP1O_13360 [Nocardia sp. CA-151230]|uniref:hypothetical protein n=1 Tax=Nocardia sp. CA-151230 TaxID=3239982 RepID=UPI003D91297E